MREWWISLQPDSRGGEWPLSRDIAEGENWADLKKGGSSGFGLIVIGLNWWVRDAQSTKDQNEVASVIEDVVFVLGKMLESMDNADDAAPSKKKKKSVASSFLIGELTHGYINVQNEGLISQTERLVADSMIPSCPIS